MIYKRSKRNERKKKGFLKILVRILKILKKNKGKSEINDYLIDSIIKTIKIGLHIVMTEKKKRIKRN